MVRCVLVPVDGTPFGEACLPLAASLAQASGALLRLAHVHVPLVPASGVEAVAFTGPWVEDTKDQTRAYLEGLATRISRAHDVEVRCCVLDGPVDLSLEQHALDCGAQLVVMSTHAHVRVRRLWHQGVAEYLSRRLDVPVLMIRPQGECAPIGPPSPDRRPPRILVALDREPGCDLVLDQALAVGEPLGARFTLLTVSDHSTDPFGVESTRFIEAAAQMVRRRGIACDAEVRVADPTSVAILDFIQTANHSSDPIDLAAVGQPRAPGVLSRLFTVSTPDELLLEGSVPVLFCRRPARPALTEALLPLPAS